MKGEEQHIKTTKYRRKLWNLKYVWEGWKAGITWKDRMSNEKGRNNTWKKTNSGREIRWRDIMSNENGGIKREWTIYGREFRNLKCVLWLMVLYEWQEAMKQKNSSKIK